MAADRADYFFFNPDYINDAHRPTLSLSYKNKMGGLITTDKSTRLKLPPFFSNLLPEGSLRDYLAKHAGVHPEREFFLLSALGQDLPGAITVKAFKEYSPLQEALPDKKLPGATNAYRFSLAGIQLKFSALMDKKGRLTIPAHGVGGEWIIKLPSMRFSNVPENEYSMMMLAKMIGIDVPEVQLISLKNVQHFPDDLQKMGDYAFAIRRFDRPAIGQKIHIEDFAQIFGLYPHEKYEKGSYKNIAEVIWRETAEQGIVEFIRRLIFNTFIGNADMHFKNWSFIYRNTRDPSLSPAYDFVSTIAYIPDEQMALNFVKTKNINSLSLESLEYLSNKAGLPQHLIRHTALDFVDQFKNAWQNESAHLPLNEMFIDTINRNLKKIPLYNKSS